MGKSFGCVDIVIICKNITVSPNMGRGGGGGYCLPDRLNLGYQNVFVLAYPNCSQEVKFTKTKHGSFHKKCSANNKNVG